MYDIETRTCEVKNFFAGDFPTLTETGTAGEDLAEHMPVAKNDEGNIVAVTAATAKSVVGITAAEAAGGDPVVYYLTGEYFEEGLNLPKDVTADMLKEALRKLSIFLRTLG